MKENVEQPSTAPVMPESLQTASVSATMRLSYQLIRMRPILGQDQHSAITKRERKKKKKKGKKEEDGGGLRQMTRR